MPVKPRKRGRLFYKFLFVLLLVSLGPLLLAGYYMLNISKAILKRYTLANQQALTIGLTDTVQNYVFSFRNVLFDAARLQEMQGHNSAAQQTALNHLLQAHTAFIELSVADSSGNEVVRVSRFTQSKLRNLSNDAAFSSAMRDREYEGSLERFMGKYPAMVIALQIASAGRPAGVLLAKLSLNGLSSILNTGFPEASESQAAVVSPDGFLIAHSDPSMVFRPDAKMPPQVLDILLRSSSRVESGEIDMLDGSRVLAAFSEVKNLGWIVYIQQPVSTVERASEDMLSKTMKALLFVVALALFLSYMVSSIIVQPIQMLREAASKLADGQFEDLPELKMPNDEIGDLAQTFSQMSESLRIKTAELMSAKDELEKLNRSLEARVEVRTRELRSAHDELVRKERLAAIGQMASVVGHEIRNPLAVINNSVYFIKVKLGAAADPKIAKHIAIVESEVQQANGIINEILGFARTRELMLSHVALNSYVEDVLSSYPFPAHIAVAKTYSADNPSVNIDTEEMKQALRNIIGNAVEVMPGRGTLAVRVETTADAFARIDVSDTGPGIPKDVIDKMFAPFFTTKARGTGLGLAVVRKVLDRHKGRVEAASEIGKGTTFSLYLPLAGAPPQRPEHAGAGEAKA